MRVLVIMMQHYEHFKYKYMNMDINTLMLITFKSLKKKYVPNNEWNSVQNSLTTNTLMLEQAVPDFIVFTWMQDEVF